MQKYIQKLKRAENLSRNEIEDVMRQIMSGDALKEEIREFLLDLRAKGPSIEEITGAAKIMREFVIKINSKHKRILDTCGTGGDKKNTFNISTVTALVVASCGVAVAKHGNRSVSSKCGSADILEGLGININLDDQQISECLDQVGIAFLFAQKLHPAMKNVAPVRKELGVETIFNILGPLTNPADATHQIMGIYSRDYVEPMTHVLKNLGLKRALVVHGSDGLDEITTTAKTFVGEFDGREIRSYDVSPEEFGVSLAEPKDLEGGDLKQNVQIVEEILNGADGPKTNIVIINAAYALYVAEEVKNISNGISKAKEAIQSKKAFQKLDELRQFTNRQ